MSNMDFSTLDDSFGLSFSNFQSQMQSLDSSQSGSSAPPSPFLPSPNLHQYSYLDLPQDSSFFLFGCNPATYHQEDYFQQFPSGDAPVAIAPYELHAPVANEQPVLPVMTVTTFTIEQPELCQQQQEPVTLENAPIVIPPPKRARQRATAKLLQSAKDSSRHHACTECIRRFKRRADLARHLKRHNGVQDYLCLAPSCPLPVSERRFFRADARQRHWKRHPQCEAEFYLTPAGVEWLKKNKNRSQKSRAARHHGSHDSRETSVETSGHEYDDDTEDDDGEYRN